MLSDDQITIREVKRVLHFGVGGNYPKKKFLELRPSSGIAFKTLEKTCMGSTAKVPVENAIGRELQLEFTGDPPELTSIEFRYSKGFESTRLGRGKSGLQWNALAKAFSRFVLTYLLSDPSNDKQVRSKQNVKQAFEFSGPPRDSDAATLGTEIINSSSWLGRVLAKKIKNQPETSIVHEIFLRGANVSGKNTNYDRILHLDTSVLPRDCVTILWRVTPGGHSEPVTKMNLRVLHRKLGTRSTSKKKQTGYSKKVSETELLPLVSLGHFRMPATELFGRSEWIEKLNEAWENSSTRVFTLWAWGGVGKTAVVAEWLKQMEVRNFRGAEAVLAWSLDVGDSGAADAFLTFALSFFGNGDHVPIGRWEKGHRLAQLIQSKRTLLILDGLESLQQSPTTYKARLADPAMVGLLCELNHQGLCIITTRYPVADLEPYRNNTAVRQELDPLSPEAGRQLLRSFGIKGPDHILEWVSTQFKGHALTLTLLGSYLATAWKGKIQRWDTVKLLKVDVAREGHAKSIMAAYESLFQGKGELLILKLMGLFHRPPDSEDLDAFRLTADIPGLTDALHHLSESDWATLIQSLIDKRLIVRTGAPGQETLDSHPLVREYFAEQLRNNSPIIWERGQHFLFKHYAQRAPHRPNNIRSMEYLFCSVIHACKAGKHQEALESVYIPRIMRGDQRYAAENLGALASLLVVLSHFFRDGSWLLPEQTLKQRDQLYLLIEAARYLTEVNGYGAPEVEQCYSKGLTLCTRKHERIELMLGLCRVFRFRAQLEKSGAIANELLTLSKGFKTLHSAAERALATNLFYSGEFRDAFRHAKKGIRKTRSLHQALNLAKLDVNEPSISCLGYVGLCDWFLGRPDRAIASIDLASKKAAHLGHHHTIAVVLLMEAMIRQLRLEVAETQKNSIKLIDFCADKGFFLWRIAGQILRGWADVNLTKVSSGLKIEDFVEEWKDYHAELFLPYWFGLWADTSIIIGDLDGASDAVEKGLFFATKNGEHWWDCELLRTRGRLGLLGNSPGKAFVDFQLAAEYARKHNSPVLELRALTSLVELSKGKDLTSKRMLSTCFSTFKEGLQTSDLLKASSLLKNSIFT